MTDIVEDTDLLESTDTPEADPIADLEVTSITAADVAAVDTSPEPQESVLENTVEVDESITEDLTADEPVVDWEKRYNDQSTYLGQRASEIHSLQQQVSGYEQLGDPQVVAQQLQQFKEQSEKSELKAWNSRSPEYSNFQSTRSKADAINKLVNDANPEDRDAIIRSASGQFSADEQAMLGAYSEHNANTQRQMAEDPEGYIGNLVEDMIQSRFNEYEQYKGQEAQTNQYITENSDLIDRNREDFMHIIGDQGNRSDLALQYVQMKEELAQLRASVGQSLESQVQAEAQSTATKQSATVTRDLNSSIPSQDPVKLAKEKGLSGTKALRFIQNYNKGH